MTYDKIYLKITTVPNQMEVDMESTEIQIFKRKYEAHKSFLKDSDVELAYLNESAVNGSFAKIYSLTLGFVHETIPVVKTMFGDERDLLDKLLSVLRQDEFKNATVIMYNRAFILSFLSKRLRRYGYPISMLPVSLQSFDKKAWTIKGSKCIQDYVKGISYQTENFSETCFIHGIEPDFIEGSDVARYIKKEQFDVVHQSDIRYVNALIEIDNQLSEGGQLGKLTVVVENIGEVKKEEVNVLEHILASGQLSKPVIKAVVEYAEANDLNKTNVLTLVKTALSKTKEYQNVPEEDYDELQEALGLKVDYKDIECVFKKGNLGKKEANELIKKYKKSTEAEKVRIVGLVESFLIDKNKIGQKRAKESFDFLISELISEEMQNLVKGVEKSLEDKEN